MLNVPTGNIKIFPDSDPVDGRIALGSVQVAKTDFLRSSLVGMAPFIVGCILLYAATAILFGPLLAQPTLTDAFNWLTQQSELLLNPITWLWFYFIIAVSNTMFMSKEDTKPLPFLGFIILLILTAIFISGQAQAVAQAIWPPIQSVIRALGTAFSLTLVIDLLSLTLLYGLQRLLQKLTRKKIIFH